MSSDIEQQEFANGSDTKAGAVWISTAIIGLLLAGQLCGPLQFAIPILLEGSPLGLFKEWINLFSGPGLISSMISITVLIGLSAGNSSEPFRIQHITRIHLATTLLFSIGFVAALNSLAILIFDSPGSILIGSSLSWTLVTMHTAITAVVSVAALFFFRSPVAGISFALCSALGCTLDFIVFLFASIGA